ncbi:MAG: hypothetical protein MI924_32040, partial [Chloroflexales bacterium]|nr:hypothetical protein [Chloroflexales bacterium]
AEGSASTGSAHAGEPSGFPSGESAGRSPLGSTRTVQRVQGRTEHPGKGVVWGLGKYRFPSPNHTITQNVCIGV